MLQVEGETPSGTITSIGYGKTSGLSGGLGAAGLLAGAFTPQSDADTAAQLKAEADVIAQQQRVLRCRNTPDACV
jgi:hypothetical protein